MTQNEKLICLIKCLLNENLRYNKVEIPHSINEQFNLYRSHVNVRMPEPISQEYLSVEDEFLQEVLGAHISDYMMRIKETEWEEYCKQVTNWEIEQYLSTI